MAGIDDGEDDSSEDDNSEDDMWARAKDEIIKSPVNAAVQIIKDTQVQQPPSPIKISKEAIAELSQKITKTPEKQRILTPAKLIETPINSTSKKPKHTNNFKKQNSPIVNNPQKQATTLSNNINNKQ